MRRDPNGVRYVRDYRSRAWRVTHWGVDVGRIERAADGRTWIPYAGPALPVGNGDCLTRAAAAAVLIEHAAYEAGARPVPGTALDDPFPVDVPADAVDAGLDPAGPWGAP